MISGSNSKSWWDLSISTPSWVRVFATLNGISIKHAMRAIPWAK